MQDPSRKNQELLDENHALKQRIKELEHSEAERKRAEEALQASENRLREITTQIPGVVYQYYVMPNGATGFYYISDKSEQVIGLKPDLEGYFERFSAIVIPEHRDSFIKSIEKSVKELSEWKYEGMLQKPSGEIIWFSGNSTPSLREDEIVFNGIVIDISARKRAEETLQLSEERFRLLVKNSSDITGIVDPDGKQRYVSDTAERITGFTASELASKNISEVIHPDDLLGALEAFQGCLAHPDKLLRAEYRHIHKTKGWVYVEAIGQNFIDDPNIRGVITNVRDITNRKKAEDALKLSEITYREIFNTINDCIWVHDIETGKFLDINNKVTEMFGYSFKEAMNLNLEDISSGVPPYTQETAMELFRKASDGDPQLFEWHCKHKDGHLFWTEVNLKRGSIAGKERILAIKRDITERKRAEERLRQAHDKLEQRVAERTEELRQTNEKLLMDITERKRIEEALQESEERYKSIVGSVKLGITLIDKNHKIIMTNKYFAELFNKPEAYFIGKYCFMESEKRDAICPHCPGMLSMASREPAEVETEGILDDGSRFNALIRTVPTFASDGTVSGFIEVVEDITERKRVANVLDEERRRLQQTLDEIRTLRGIVPICANCKNIRDDKGYWNQVEKYVSEHSEAEFSHGICPDCAKKLYPDIYQEKKMNDLQRSVILLVDDEEDFRMIFIRQIKQILKDHEFEFIEASDGEEALELLKGGAKPSIIILDYAMPKINGMELLRRIDSDHRDLYDVHRIMISGYAQKEIISEAQRLRCVFLEKSMDNIFYHRICQHMTNTLDDLAHNK
ncbi:MAG: PAS domain S-box protein [Syntrophales bacterium]